jgi:hypothetical protein
MPDATPPTASVSRNSRLRLRVIPIAILLLIGIFACVDSWITIIPIISGLHILSELWRLGELAVPGMGLLACAVGFLLLVSIVCAVISWERGKWWRASVCTLTVATCLAWNVFRSGISSYVVLQSIVQDGNVPGLIEVREGEIWLPPDRYRVPWFEDQYRKATQSPSSVDSAPKYRVADTSNTDPPGEEANRESIQTEDERHLVASGKVFDIMMEEIDPQTFQKWTNLLPTSSQEEQQAFAEKMLRVFRSDEFRRDYCAILMEIFSAEECERLSVLLSDPVLRKFQQRKVEYMTRMFSLTVKYLEDDSSVR